MAKNNVTHTLDFKYFSEEYVSNELDKVLTCEGQNIKFWNSNIGNDTNGRPKFELVMEINGEMLLLKRTNRFDYKVRQIEMKKKGISDEDLLTIIKDLIGFNNFKICQVLNRQL